MITINNYMDWGSIFTNEVIGDVTLAYVILMIILIVALIRLGFNEKLVLAIVFFSSMAYLIVFSILIVKIIAGIIAIIGLVMIPRIFNR